MGNVHVAEQTATAAKVRAYMMITSVPASDRLNVLATGTYKANFERRNGHWVITRWYIEPRRAGGGVPNTQERPAGVDRSAKCLK